MTPGASRGRKGCEAYSRTLAPPFFSCKQMTLMAKKNNYGTCRNAKKPAAKKHHQRVGLPVPCGVSEQRSVYRGTKPAGAVGRCRATVGTRGSRTSPRHGSLGSSEFNSMARSSNVSTVKAISPSTSCRAHDPTHSPPWTLARGAAVPVPRGQS